MKMDFLKSQKGAVMTVLVIALAAFITLGVCGLIPSKLDKEEKVADDIVKLETGVDVKQTEEQLLKK
jgi:hypothetical protein